jgi:SAM-dependent methyltransferase
LILRLRFGDLTRTSPLSEWGFERGTPIDRWYIERYLEGCSSVITGHALEVQDDLYASRYGAQQVDVLDIDPTNARATIVGDLCSAETLRDNQYDTVLVTQTLQLVVDPAAALRNLVRSLRPGGSLLLTAPTTSRLAAAEDRWRWTPAGMRTLLDSVTPAGSRVEVLGMGNLLSCRAFLIGAGAEELDADILAQTDSMYPLLVGAHVQLPRADLLT